MQRYRKRYPINPRKMSTTNDSGLRERLPKRHHVYILNCQNSYLYTGYTVDLKRRLIEHRKGVGSKFTRSHLPVELVYSETYRSRSQALKRERVIKRLSRSKKLLLTDGSSSNYV